MSFTDLGSLGATGSSAPTQVSLSLTTSADANVGELIVVVIADDNRLATADAAGLEVAMVSDTSGLNTWVKAADWANNNGAAQAGAAISVWFTTVISTISAGDTITATFTDSTLSGATGLTARHYSKAGSLPALDGMVAVESVDGSSVSSLNVVTANRSCLRIRAIAGAVGSSTSLTPTSGWTAWDNGNSATSGTGTEMCARAEHLISSEKSAESLPTWVTCNSASAYVAFRDAGIGAIVAPVRYYLVPPFVGPPGPTPTPSAYGSPLGLLLALTTADPGTPVSTAGTPSGLLLSITKAS